MAAQPQRSSGARLRTRAEIALFREREEALEAQAKRRLAEAEVGHRRFALFERAIILTLWLISIGLALISALSIPLAALIAGGGLSTALGLLLTLDVYGHLLPGSNDDGWAHMDAHLAADERLLTG